MTQIHPSAIVDPAAELAEDVKVGPFCLVGPSAKLAAGVELVSHVVVEGNTSIGERTKVYPFASLGHPPQDLKYHGEDNQLLIGSDNVIREQVTMNPGTEGGGGLTQIGNNGTFLTASHVGHDCLVGDHVVFSNNVMLAGHCKVSDFAILSGGCGVHQFVRIGPHAFIGGLAGVAGTIGIIIGGIICDRLGKKDVRYQLWFITAVGVAGMPLGIGALFAPNIETTIYMFIFPIAV
ncbi:MAG: acyl-ACP--UDP-N-acetylglucosamine O-acyltransferase, partial [Parvibaculaceae bacterium]|nr:acyl-ACP--UDP-N-acetylglucosamine O-acyltransferase [Parvibaculaceae bacterium]